MKVRVDSISEEGLTLKEQLDPGLWDIDSPDIKFTGSINISCEFKRIGDEILVKAYIFACMQSECNRCLEESKKNLNKEVYLAYNTKELAQSLDIDNDLREEILIDWPMKFLCRKDCRGICPGCGVNLNTEKCGCKKIIKH